MAKFPTMEQMARNVAEKAMQNITINGMIFSEFVENLYNEAKNNHCHFSSCRYNCKGTCQNQDKRKECVEVSRKVLCLEGMNEIVSQKEKE